MSIQEEVRAQEQKLRLLEEQVARARLDADRHEEQISGARGLTAAIDTLLTEVQTMRKEFAASRQGLSRGEKIALLGSGAGFIGALAAASALLLGA